MALRESLNNVLERMNGSIREREKVMRGIKVGDTPIIPMNQIYYNFIRPHMGLDGISQQRWLGWVSNRRRESMDGAAQEKYIKIAKLAAAHPAASCGACKAPPPLSS